jgi:hypothetical protein
VGWRWRVISLPDFMGNIALPHVHVPVGVADTVVPNYWVVNHVAGPDRGVPWALVTRPLRVVGRTAGPGGLGGTCGQAQTRRKAGGKQPPRAMIFFRVRVLYIAASFHLFPPKGSRDRLSNP